jgi:hypothetical protein
MAGSWIGSWARFREPRYRRRSIRRFAYLKVGIDTIRDAASTTPGGAAADAHLRAPATR